MAARHASKIEPENPQTWVTIAAVATRLMRQEEALEAYERAAALKPDEAHPRSPSATCRRRSAGAPKAKPRTRLRWRSTRALREA